MEPSPCAKMCSTNFGLRIRSLSYEVSLSKLLPAEKNWSQVLEHACADLLFAWTKHTHIC